MRLSGVKLVDISGVKIGGGNPLVLIAGPCVIESRDILFATARRLCEISEKTGVKFIFKSSYDKGNRSSVKSFRGVGTEEGLQMLCDVRKEFGIPVTSDVHSAEEAEKYGRLLDLVQIPALLCRQTDILAASAETGKPVNVKKGQFMAPWDIKNIFDKMKSAGNENVLITERGTTFGYNNLVCDMRSLVIMREFGYPVVFDATHIVQLPGGMGDKSTGERKFISPLARAAVSIGIDALFMEVHPKPDIALCDGPNMLNLDDLETLLLDLKQIDKMIKRE